MGQPFSPAMRRLRWEAPELRRLISRSGIGALVMLFLGCLAPYAAFFLTHHPDERHYTDAGIEMLRRGDYLTPYTAGGIPRLKKPIVPYWMTAVSYRYFGVSAASSRLLFLLAGGAVVWLTYRLAWAILEDRTWALMAALIVACNPSLLISAPRSVPDIALCLFLLLSTTGFVSMIRRRRTTWGALAAAYGGGALAVLSKGLPALVFVGYAVAFFVLISSVRREQQWRRHAVGWGAGVVLIASWFALMAHLHGDRLGAAFLEDQVGEGRIADSPAIWTKHFLLILTLIAACLLPWLIPLAGSRFGWRAFAARLVRRPEYLFLLGWIGVWIVLASLVDRVNLRYLLPLAPLLSVLAAHAWKEADPARLARAARPGWWLAILALMAATAASAGIAVSTGHLLFALILLAAAAAIVPMFVSAGREADALGLARIAVSACLLMLASASVGLGCLVLPDAADRIAQELRGLPGTPDRCAVWIGEPAVAARVRIHLRGEFPLKDAQVPHSSDLENANLVVLRSDEAAGFGPEWSTVRTFAHGYRGMDARDLVRAVLRGEARSFLDSHRQNIVIAVRREYAETPSLHTAGREAAGNPAMFGVSR
jgi:4-amino-4-deoxy-L-arabinose transferase-like glycosyltransferase